MSAVAMKGRIEQRGNTLYKRTTLMIHKRANQFASCIMRNALYREVELLGSVKAIDAGSEKAYYVRWIPASIPAQEKMLDHIIGKREAKATDEAANYTFHATDKPGWYACLHDKSAVGEDSVVYAVHEKTGCARLEEGGCEDMNFRCRPLGIVCKHTLALRNYLAPVSASAPVEVVREETREERHARIQRDIELDF